MLGSIGRQKFTKALVLSSGVSVEEVDVSHAPARRLALLAAPPSPARAARRGRLLAAARAVDRRHAGARLHAGGGRDRDLRDRLLDREQRLPRAALRRSRHSSRPRHPGFRPGADRRVAGTGAAGRREPAAVHDRGGACEKRVLVTGGAGFISSNFVRHLLEATEHDVVTLDALTYAGNLENLADVMSHPRLSFVHGDIRNADARARARRGRGRDRERRGRVARREVDRARRLRVRDDERRGDSDPARRDPRRRPSSASSSSRRPRCTAPPIRADGRGASAQPALALRGDEGRRRPARLLVLDDVRPADRDRAAVQQLRAAPASREGRAALHHAGARRRAADRPRRRPRVPRLAVRRRRRRGDPGGDRGAARRRSPAR